MFTTPFSLADIQAVAGLSEQESAGAVRGLVDASWLVVTRGAALDSPGFEGPSNRFLTLAAPHLLTLSGDLPRALAGHPLPAFPGGRPPRVIRLYALAEDGTAVRLSGLQKLASGLDCPFCVGFWIGAGVLAADRLASQERVLDKPWRFAKAALALNYVTAHLGARLGDTPG